MVWTADAAAGQAYSLTHGTCHAKVWHSGIDQWAVFVSHPGVSIGQHSFTTLQDAQAWCEGRLREFVADGHCAADAGPSPR